MCHAVVGTGRVPRVADRPDHAAVADHHPLGPAGRARGVDDVDRLERIDLRRLERLLRGAPVRIPRRQLEPRDPLRPARRQLVARPRAGHHQPRAAVLDHEGQPRRRVFGIEGDVTAAGEHHAQGRHHHLERAREAQADRCAGAHPGLAQAGRQPPGAAGEILVSHRARAALDRHRVRPRPGLLREQRGQARRPRVRGLRARPGAQHLVPLGRGEQRERGDRPVGRGEGVGQEGAEVAEEALPGGAFEEVRRELQGPDEPPAALGEVQDQVGLGGSGRDLEELGAKAREARSRALRRADRTSPGRAACGSGRGSPPAPPPAARRAGPGARRLRARSGGPGRPARGRSGGRRARSAPPAC